MRKETAIKRGLRNTCICGFSYEEVREKLKELKAKGYRVLFVSDPPSKYDRNPRNFYNVYAEQRYFFDQAKETIQKKLANIPNRRASLIIKHAEEMEQLATEEHDLIAKLTEMKFENWPK